MTGNKFPLEKFPLEIRRVFDASCADVFRAWLDRDEWQAWIGPEGVHCDLTEFDPRVGGRYRLVMHLPSGDSMVVAGEFKSIEQDRHFSFTWGSAHDAAQTTLVLVTLCDLDGSTELTLRQEGLPSAALRDSHIGGWQSALNKLIAHVAA
jgi:uncharacterized protein YndB with AHSA1/START domain